MAVVAYSIVIPQSTCAKKIDSLVIVELLATIECYVISGIGLVEPCNVKKEVHQSAERPVRMVDDILTSDDT